MAGRTVSSHPKMSISAARKTVLCDLSKNLQENWKMYKRYTQVKRGCYVLDFLGHSQDISGLSNQHSRAPLIQATSGGRGAMSSSYWSDLPSLCHTQLAFREVKLPVQEARSHLDLWLAEIEGRHRDLQSISWSELLSIIRSRLLPVSIWPAAEKNFELFQRGHRGFPNC